MRASSYCLSDEFDLNVLEHHFVEKNYKTKRFDHVLRIFDDTQQPHAFDVFIFSYGSVILWGYSSDGEKSFLNELKSLTITFFGEKFFEFCTARIGDTTQVFEEDDMLELASDDPYLRLSFSHGLAQSVKLQQFENSVVHLLDSTRPILKELSHKGKTSLSHKQLSKKISNLFVQRNSINLHCDILDVPEFFWRRPKYEPFYLMAAEYMNIEARMEILNKRLDSVRDLYDLLSDELKHHHSSFLEVIIIILILMEVVLAVFKDILKWI